MAKPRYTVMIRTLITPEQHAALVAAAMAAGTGASEVVRDALDTWLERIGPTEPRNDSATAEATDIAALRSRVDGIQQHSAGFAAHCNGAELDSDQPAAWRQGWLDAYELGELAPLARLRQEAEV